MAPLNTDFPSSRKGNLESENMENISIEVYINDKNGLSWASIKFHYCLTMTFKMLTMGIYKAPSMSDNDFSTYFY